MTPIEESRPVPIDYDVYLQSDSWRAKADAAKQRAGYRCQICNRSEDEIELQAHHRTYERLGHELPEDITVLCEDCHALYSRYAKLAAAGLWPGADSPQWRPTPLAEAVSRRLDAAESEPGEPVLSGLLDVDKLLGGLNPSDLTIVPARHDAGKTAFALSLVFNAASFFKRGVVVFSLQHSLDQVSNRLLGMALGKPVDLQQVHGLAQPDQDAIRGAADAVSGVPLLIDDTPMLTTRDFRDKCLRLVGEESIDLAIIDGLEMMSPGAHHGCRPGDEVSAACRDLKLIARELQLPVLATLSVNPGSQRADRRLTLEDLPEGVSRYADAVLVLYALPPDPSTPSETSTIVEAILAKNRNGPSGDVQLLLRYAPPRFENPETHRVDLRRV